MAVLNDVMRFVGKGKAREVAVDGEDVRENFHASIVDVVDGLLERADTCIDQHLGRITKPAIAINPAPLKKTKVIPANNKPSIAPGVKGKPQTLFKKSIDNSDTAWYPNIAHKYHARVPLGYVYRDADADETEQELSSTHPYIYELKTPALSYPSSLLSLAHPSASNPPITPTDPLPIASTPITFVSTVEEYHKMMRTILQSKPTAIALDLEHHDYRTYGGERCGVVAEGFWTVRGGAV